MLATSNTSDGGNEQYKSDNGFVDWTAQKKIEQSKREKAAQTRWLNKRGLSLDESPEKHPYSGMETNRDTDYATEIVWQDPGVEGYFLADHLYLSKKAYWKYQDHQNKGKRSGKWWNSTLDTYGQKAAIAESLASKLELTHYQEERVKSKFISIDTKRSGVLLELTAYAVCCYVLKEDDNCLRITHPQSAKRDELFTELEQELLISRLGKRRKDVIKTYGKVQHQIQAEYSNKTATSD
jgi:hypothetical protein